MEYPTVWAATRLEGKFLVSELVLRPDKLLRVLDGELYSEMKDGTACLGALLGLSANPEQLEDVLPVSPGDEVLIISARQ